MKLSFKLKLTLLLFSALITVFIAQVIIVNHYTEKFAIEYENTEMKEYIELCQKIYFSELQLNNEKQLDIELEHFYFQVRDEKNDILYSSPKIKKNNLDNIKIKEQPENSYFFNDVINDALFRFYIEKKIVDNKFYKFIYFISSKEYHNFIKKINALFLVIFTITIIILFVISNLFVNRALMPIDKIINDVNKINIKTLSGRIENIQSNDLLDKLTTTFNFMIERLEISFNRINRFFSDFSHEIKNPLAVIKNGIELIQKSNKLSEDEYNILNRLSEEVEAVQRMTNELLFLAKADADSVKLNFSKIKLKELTAFSEDIGKIMCEEKQIKFSIETQDLDKELEIDEHKIKQVIINLLNNAVEYTNQNGLIRLTFKIEGDKFIFTITDNGCGIAQEQIPLVFDRFYRCDKTRSREKHHFGLGLSIVKMIIDLHNGTINLDSELNKGATVKFTIPIKH
ncbi:MAG TPA: HAMP domain-containing sensor histidine kinase [bacterium]|nr:HAMP domain-containing sensor histidine kinase [bacterium]